MFCGRWRGPLCVLPILIGFGSWKSLKRPGSLIQTSLEVELPAPTHSPSLSSLSSSISLLCSTSNYLILPPSPLFFFYLLPFCSTIPFSVFPFSPPSAPSPSFPTAHSLPLPGSSPGTPGSPDLSSSPTRHMAPGWVVVPLLQALGCQESDESLGKSTSASYQELIGDTPQTWLFCLQAPSAVPWDQRHKAVRVEGFYGYTASCTGAVLESLQIVHTLRGGGW